MNDVVSDASVLAPLFSPVRALAFSPRRFAGGILGAHQCNWQPAFGARGALGVRRRCDIFDNWTCFWPLRAACARIVEALSVLTYVPV
jgi:hypothetical protein